MPRAQRAGELLPFNPVEVSFNQFSGDYEKANDVEDSERKDDPKVHVTQVDPQGLGKTTCRA